MTNSFGIGFTFTGTIGEGGIGADQGVQYALIRDGETGEIFFARTIIGGLSISPLPADASIDIFTIPDGLPPNDLSGDGYFYSASSVVTASLILNDSHEVIGVGSGFQSNIGMGGYRTYTEVMPIDEVPPSVYLPFVAAFAATFAALPFGFAFALSVGFGTLFGTIVAQILDPLALDLDGDGIELVSLNDANGDSLSTAHLT